MTQKNKEQLDIYCEAYFDRLAGKQGTSKSKMNAGAGKIIANRKRRKYKYIGTNLWSPGPDIQSNVNLDKAIIEAFSSIPDPTIQYEIHFIILKETRKDKIIYKSSKKFNMPENGGFVAYECWLNEWIDWDNVVATCHTHPLYNHQATDRENKHFSNGDPTGLIVKAVPVFMRTPKTRQIKALEIREGFVTTRIVYGPSTGTIQKWKKRR